MDPRTVPCLLDLLARFESGEAVECLAARAKLLRFDRAQRVLVLSDGCVHCYADWRFDETGANASPPSLLDTGGALKPQWVLVTDWEARAGHDSETALAVHALEPLVERHHTAAHAGEMLLSTPWDLVGPMEVNAGTEQLRAAIAACVGRSGGGG